MEEQGLQNKNEHNGYFFQSSFILMIDFVIQFTIIIKVDALVRHHILLMYSNPEMPLLLFEK